jgi:hypothetical protein
MLLDPSGNLGLGIAPSAAWASSPYLAAQFGYGGVIMSSAVSVGVTVFNTGANFKYDGSDYRRINAEEASQYQQASGAHNWRIAASSTANSVITWTQAMTLGSDGNLFLGTTTTPTGTGSGRFNVEPGNRNGIAIGVVTTGNTGLDINVDSTGSYFDYYRYNNANVGSITTNGTTTSYNTTSDQRLKENIADADLASTLIDSLQVRQFDWKSDGSHTRYGFVAQELVTVAPEAVHQPEDPEQMMAVDYSKLVPMLVKEIQSLRQRLAAAGI